jgi:putative ABC transport system permease protein
VKYLPLIWAALWRKPAESVLTWLAVIVAFALFGMMIGLNGTYHSLIQTARQDRMYVNARFEAHEGLPLALSEQLRRVAGVVGVSAADVICGYYVSPRDTVCVYFADEGMQAAAPEFGITAEQWHRLFQSRNGLLVSRSAAQKWNLREGDVFPLVTAPGIREDGATAWELRVVALVPDAPSMWNGNFMIGDYHYLDAVRAVAERGKVTVYRLAVNDGRRTAQIARRIDQLFANSGTPTLSISERAAAQAMANTNVDLASTTLTIAGAGLFMILFLMANAVARSVRERVPEFAVLKTVGFSDRSVLGLVFLEAAIPCFTGAVLGTGLAAAVAHWQLRFIPADIVQIPKPDVSLLVLAGAVGLALSLALVSCAVPIMRLRRLDVAAALGEL